MWCLRLGISIRRVLDDDHNKVFVGSYHNLVLLRSDPEECQIIRRVEVSYYTSSFVSQLSHQPGILHSRSVVKRALHSDSCKGIQIRIGGV